MRNAIALLCLALCACDSALATPPASPSAPPPAHEAAGAKLDATPEPVLPASSSAPKVETAYERCQAVWAAFQAIPRERRTWQMLNDALDEVAGVVAASKSPGDALAMNARMMRTFTVELWASNGRAGADARALGDRKQAIQPAGDVTECNARVRATRSNARDLSILRGLGFEYFYCGQAVRSTVTGAAIVRDESIIEIDPAKVLPPPPAPQPSKKTSADAT